MSCLAGSSCRSWFAVAKLRIKTAWFVLCADLSVQVGFQELTSPIRSRSRFFDGGAFGRRIPQPVSLTDYAVKPYADWTALGLSVPAGESRCAQETLVPPLDRLSCNTYNFHRVNTVVHITGVFRDDVFQVFGIWYGGSLCVGPHADHIFGETGFMLVLSRKKNESIVIDENIVITVVEVRGDKVRLGIQAPREIPIHRSEIHDAIMSEQQAAKEEPPAVQPAEA